MKMLLEVENKSSFKKKKAFTNCLMDAKRLPKQEVP